MYSALTHALGCSLARSGNVIIEGNIGPANRPGPPSNPPLLPCKLRSREIRDGYERRARIGLSAIIIIISRCDESYVRISVLVTHVKEWRIVSYPMSDAVACTVSNRLHETSTIVRAAFFRSLAWYRKRDHVPRTRWYDRILIVRLDIGWELLLVIVDGIVFHSQKDGYAWNLILYTRS